jgi:hypothetical protein
MRREKAFQAALAEISPLKAWAASISRIIAPIGIWPDANAALIQSRTCFSSLFGRVPMVCCSTLNAGKVAGFLCV